MKNILRTKRLISWILVLGFYLPCIFAQSQSAEVLSPFDIERERGLRFEDLNQLDSAVACYKRAEALAISSHNQVDLAVILNDLGIVHRKLSDYVACKNYHQRAIDLVLKSNDTEILEMSLHGLGSLYEQTGDYDDAVACYLHTIKLTQERGDQTGMIITRQNLAKTYMHLSFKDASIKEIETALQSAKELKNDSLSANVLHDYAEILIYFKDYAAALSKMESALKTYQSINYDRYIGSSLVYLGDIYAKIGQTEHAFNSFEKALIYAEKMDRDVLADLYLKIGDYYEKKKNLPIAKIYFEKSFELSKLNAFKAIHQLASWRLYQIYRKQDIADQALSYLEQSALLKDELYNAEKTGRAAELQLKYDNEKQLKALHAMQLRQNRYIFYSSILALLVIIGALFYHARTKSRNNHLLALKNSEIADQNRQLADHINVLKQYSYAAAHDLKEPLRTITSFVSLLETRYIKDIEAPEAKEYMQFISNSAKRMNLLLTDLLEYNSILSQEAGDESVQPIELVYEVWDSLSTLAEEKNARLVLPSAIPGIKMNRFHFMQLIQNLVSNGLKFTRDRNAEIKIGFEQRENSFILSVTDNGIGIDEQYKEKIFQMFYRLNDLSEAEGTGIGLTIVKNIVEKYKGRIWFNSVTGAGTTFYVSLPIHLLDQTKETPKAAFNRQIAATL